MEPYTQQLLLNTSFWHGHWLLVSSGVRRIFCLKSVECLMRILRLGRLSLGFEWV